MSFSAVAQKKHTMAVLDSIIHHAEHHSLYRNQVDWDVIKDSIKVKTADADSVIHLRSGLEYLMKELGDGHGRIFHKGAFLAYHTAPLAEHKKDIDWEVFTRIQYATEFPFEARMIGDEIGYVRIVGLPTGDNEAMSNEIQMAVCKLMDKGASSWVIDLRYNGGGNMFPMVEGLTSIIGDGPVGGAVGATKEEYAPWIIQDGDFFYDNQTVAIEEDCTMETLPKIAVLTSMYTASSGEALAVILKGRPQTRFFGEKTHGMVTSTDWKVIDDETFASISVAYYEDRNGVVYKQYVDVDEEIKFEIDSKEDIILDQGIAWLLD